MAERHAEVEYPQDPPGSLPGRRLHRLAILNPVVCNYLVEMTDFFREAYETTPSVNDYVSIEDMLKQFERSRGKELSTLEYNMFKKKCFSVLRKLFPTFKSIVRKKQRCYAFLKPKAVA